MNSRDHLRPRDNPNRAASNLMRIAIFATHFALCTFAVHAQSITKPPTDTCDLDYQFEAKWSEMPRRFDVTLSFDTDAKGEATLMGPKRWAGVDDFDKTILDVRVVEDGISLKSVESNQ